MFSTRLNHIPMAINPNRGLVLMSESPLLLSGTGSESDPGKLVLPQEVCK